MPISLTVHVDLGQDRPAEVTIVRLKPAYTHAQVPSSKPGLAPYDVVASDRGARCTCRGFLFNGQCRHATALLVALDVVPGAVKAAGAVPAGQVLGVA